MSTRARGAQRGTIGGAILIMLVIGVIGGLIFYKFSHKASKIDVTTNCPVAGPVSSTAVIFDTTDTISQIQRLAIEQEFGEIVRQIPRFGELSVYALGNKGEVTKADFARCNPGEAKDVDWLTEGQRLVVRRWQEGYRNPLDLVLRKMVEATPSEKSPILEAIQAVNLQTFGPLRSGDHGPLPLRLVIVSDLLQNSDLLSLYSKIPDSKQFTQSEAYRKIRTEMRNVDVEILLIRRQTKKGIQGQDLLKFWQELISAQNGRLVHFKPLEG